MSRALASILLTSIATFQRQDRSFRTHQFPIMAQTKVLQCDPSSISFLVTGEPVISSPETHHSLQCAALDLQTLNVVSFPTETVYGLGALALNSVAASRIFSTKGRPPDNPLIVHVSSYAMLQTLLPQGYVIPETYNILMKAFWPGALTLLFPNNPALVPSIVTAGHSTVAVRMPSHPVARALIAITDAPIAAPSANLSGKPSPTRAEHVLRDLNSKIGIIIDGGPCGIGLESTVVDGLNDDGNIRVLRPGGVTVEDMQIVLSQHETTHAQKPTVLVHKRDYSDMKIEHAPTTPGMKYRHYSPSVPVTLLMTYPNGSSTSGRISAKSFLNSLRKGTDSEPRKIGLLPIENSWLSSYDLPQSGIDWLVYFLGPEDSPSITAQRLFDGLLTLENSGVDLILIEGIKEEREGLAVMNRVKKAAGEVIQIYLD